MLRRPSPVRSPARSRRRATEASRTTPWSWAVAGVLLGLTLALLLNAPARWLAAAVEQGLQGRVLLTDARGTLWNGTARLTLTGGAGSTDAATLPGRLTWRLRPNWVGLAAELNADCCMQQPWRLSLRPRWGGARLALTDSQSQWPAQWLTGLGTPWNTVQPEGQLSLSTHGLAAEWAAGRLLLQGSAQLDAMHLSSRLSTLKPMGSYRVLLLSGASPSLSLSTLEGALQLSGTGQWVGGRLRFEGVASAAPERLDALSNLLNIIGRRDGARAIIKVG
ncbi:MAG: type II secretion system protein N [Gammaproteobacteria bacterium]|uniref:type II secretion system protein N n=1 Tax=Rhodoferax sp. TaxID=50421 RepID=UPI00179BEF1B|nr:type II secretion system protein N [Rhodoferax sp.]MBU3900471.1 type II secretion system protein N [Gammaproteobacteria bacterium]MBA3059938.1 type II secretion system protein N [Rhodoferax sp.]MBU3997125.1 type II secretion system protein N [Gammaproteobacteria bacterium]MBU4079916.1 type II secretion system protein N [Gammaproteobacteria bacterium]MBU4112931.1 type II secretion system protein N [Gammaproteobacteria bacterium]